MYKISISQLVKEALIDILENNIYINNCVVKIKLDIFTIY